MSADISVKTFLFLVALVVLLVFVNGQNVKNDDDIHFDVSNDEEIEVEFSSSLIKSDKMAEISTDSSARAKTKQQSDVIAYIGRLFHMIVTSKDDDKLKSDIKNVKRYYEAKKNGDYPLPSWLLFDKHNGHFWGVPTCDDEGHFEISIRFFEEDGGKNRRNATLARFKLTVKEPSREQLETIKKCQNDEYATFLNIVIDRGINVIKPKQRITSINNLAKFFGMSHSVFTLIDKNEPDDITDSSIILAGPGDVKNPSNGMTTVIQVPVGCDGRLWMETVPLINRLKRQTRDGTISEVLGLPVIGWRVKIDNRDIEKRDKRQAVDSGSGDYDENYYEAEYDDEYDYEPEYDDVEPKPKPTKPTVTTKITIPSTSTTTSTTTAKPTTTTTTTTTTTQEPTTTTVVTTHVPSTTIATTTVSSTTTLPPTHPHRHHHGESYPEKDETNIFDTSVSSSSSLSSSSLTTSTTTTTTEPSTPLIIKEDKSDTNDLDYEEYDYDDESETVLPESNTAPSLTTKTSSTANARLEGYSTIVLSNATTTTQSNAESTDFEFVQETTTVVPSIGTTTNLSKTTTILTSTTTVSHPTSTTIGSTIGQNEDTTTMMTTLPDVVEANTTVYDVLTTSDDATTTEKQQQQTTRSIATTIISSTMKTTTTRDITETVEYGIKNFPPVVQRRLKRIAVTAGKLFKYQIPEETFIDIEDGHNLKLEFLNIDGHPVKSNNWCQFDSRNREIYGLPLEVDVSGWEFIVKATDREGASAKELLMIHVQHHKSRRVVNHEISIHVHIEKRHEFKHDIDWSLKVLRSLGTMYRTPNLTDITVRSVNYTSDPAIFTWTNDSLPKSYCPKMEIEKIFNILTANDQGDPSRDLNSILAPEIRVKKVTYKGLSVCELQPQPPPLAPIPPSNNYSPILRNPVDHINATVGELLIFRVPDDTFYDPEDIDALNLKLTLMTKDRQPILSNSWLQFDNKNREFYGIPSLKDIGREYYQLICEDSGGLFAADSLEVVVRTLPKVRYNVEFGMSLLTPYESFVSSASVQRKFVEKLQILFHDKTTNNIHLNTISKGSTVVTWYNKSLSTDHCPYEEIKRLKTILFNNDKTIASRVQDVMDPEFLVSAIQFDKMGNCKDGSVVIHTTEPSISVDESLIPKEDGHEYLVTFIVPAVIISVILLLAGIVACVLYRKRRTGKGKLNQDEDGRQSYGNKGIPVIFQEELEEKPESGTKTPVILKDEKPPLAPPEYSKSGSLKLTDDTSQQPYQPPPPFTSPQDSAARQQRPKHTTPTYRKPPPYVPP